ncbi:MAG: AraC family transcriptional regulator [Bacteroidota bacterium]
MEVTLLPQDLQLSDTENLQLFHYQRTQDIQRTKINLTNNTISFLRAGTKEVIGDDETVKIAPQHFVIMKKGHCLMTEKVSDANQSYQSMLLFFSNAEILRFLEKYHHFLSKPDSHKSFYIFPYDEFIQNFVHSLVQIVRLPRAVQSTLLQHKFEEIMLYLVHQNSAGFLNALLQNMDDKTIRLTNIVANNKYNKLNLEELAFLCNRSVSTFKRDFFKHYHQTPMKWFSEQRLNHVALQLKAKTSRPIELYEDAGYENFSNFVQAFKKKFGVTPKQYQMQD